MGPFRSAFGILLVALAALLAPVAVHLVKPLGIFYTPKPTVLGEGKGPIRIADTIHCEDVHHYRPANLLFTACEDSKATRFEWFPGMGHLNPQSSRGSIHVVDPKVIFFMVAMMPYVISETNQRCVRSADHEVDQVESSKFRGFFCDARSRCH